MSKDTDKEMKSDMQKEIAEIVERTQESEPVKVRNKHAPKTENKLMGVKSEMTARLEERKDLPAE